MLEKVRSGGKMVESPRGHVPAGADDHEYESYLCRLEIRKLDSPTGQNARVALAASTDVRFRTFLNAVMSDTHRNTLMVTIAKKLDIGLSEFQALWRSAKTNEAIEIASNALPDLTRDMVQDAHTQENTCPMCDGNGQVQREGKPDKICPNCGGSGTVRMIGDKHARDTLIQMTGAIKKEPQIVINQDMRGLGMAAAANRLQSVPFDFTVDATPVVDVPVDTNTDPT